MNLDLEFSDPFLDEVVTRLYRAAALFRDDAFRELLRNAAVAILRAEDFDGLQRALTLADSLLVTGAALGHISPSVAQSLRDPLPLVLEPRAPATASAH
jgi:hypothetical protein